MISQKPRYIPICEAYAEAGLVASEVPSLGAGHFYLEIAAAAAGQPDDREMASSCVGTVDRFEPPGAGAWCLYDPALLQGEGSVTHVAWLWQSGVLYRLQLNGRQLDEEEPSPPH